jgi:ABC-type transporter Mla MlaB component
MGHRPPADDRLGVDLSLATEQSDTAMAFFSKPPAKKKPELVKSDATRRAGSPAASEQAPATHGVAAQAAPRHRPRGLGGADTATGHSVMPWAPGQTFFEVAEANPGLCAVLENSALHFASGQAAEARTLLEQGIESDADTRLSSLAWLALFDLMQRDGDKAAFERLSMQYLAQFESSAPAWEAKANAQAAPRAVGGYLALTGRLTAASAKQLEALKRAIARRADSTKLDLESVQGFDDAGARLLADALAEARRARVGLQLQLGNELGPALDKALKKGRGAGEGPWLLSLELLQWTNDLATFEDRAIDFAVTFELSPPSWEPPLVTTAAAEVPPEEGFTDVDSGDPGVLKWSGVLAGSIAPQLAKLADSAHDRMVVAVDMSEVERIDFVCAGAMLNVITRIETQRKAVEIVGASPIVRALMLLLGIPPRNFVKKSQ